MPEQPTRARPTGLAVWLVVAGAVGWWAALSLTLEKLHSLANPDAIASCDFSVLVQCTANLDSWQGSVFGFPNPILGLAGWVAPIVVGMALLAGARFARWFWWCFWAGIAFAFGFVIWLIAQSIYALGTLCPWCMVTWSVTIPTFYAVTLHLFRTGQFPASARVRHAADRLMAWVPLAAILSYALILLLAQLEMNAIVNIWQTFVG
ncbi:vitamin K epoxide reductase family protein [Microbacterium atlanticum]|uniref:vitamin K epoxide reductase family protein n=1 Tax=Microbacterium atlanticum TaxID=2782168 RepID=UPI001889491D|nr:vitamin K epoxide reductase family protein [Microbacterium atlanticum]